MRSAVEAVKARVKWPWKKGKNKKKEYAKLEKSGSTKAEMESRIARRLIEENLAVADRLGKASHSS
ncbi:hypothetical protein HPP92_026429 [Vanilla planifolia]|uniref:Uncharacterized protein n=1 Tax=Vanilla planifolia TaxID=51239 RepID=A0A835QP58_VANPL|nr:hypothetical protein HPP92_026429 [Vanilla planifolia]KAG0473850.1 hypothetical protein HPP92_015707 [Vanilla planifolia]